MRLSTPSKWLILLCHYNFWAMYWRSFPAETSLGSSVATGPDCWDSHSEGSIRGYCHLSSFAHHCFAAGKNWCPLSRYSEACSFPTDCLSRERSFTCCPVCGFPVLPKHLLCLAWDRLIPTECAGRSCLISIDSTPAILSSSLQVSTRWVLHKHWKHFSLSKCSIPLDFHSSMTRKHHHPLLQGRKHIQRGKQFIKSHGFEPGLKARTLQNPSLNNNPCHLLNNYCAVCCTLQTRFMDF